MGRAFGVPYLSYADPGVPPVWPVKGHCYYSQICVNLVLKRESHCLNVIFLVDTTCPKTFISSTTMQVLHPGEVPPTSVKANLHGQEMELTLSPESSHFADLNLLGADFLSKCRLWTDLAVGYEFQLWVPTDDQDDRSV